MANGVFNIAKGRAVEFYTRVDGNDPANSAFIIVLLKDTVAVVDDTLNNHDTLTDVLAVYSEANFTNYCVDADTECLTRRAGWTQYEDIRADDEILAYDQGTNTTRWERPLELYANPDYSGPMVTLSSRGFSARTTPDHRWPVVHMSGRWPHSPKAHTLTTRELPSSVQWKLLRHAPHDGPSSPAYSDAFVRIIAWYFTEGSLMSGGKSITISQSDKHNSVNVEDIRRDIKAIGAQVRIRATACTQDGCVATVHSNDMCRNHYVADYRSRKRSGEVFTPGRHRTEGLFVAERMRDHDRLITWDLFGSGVDAITACCPGKNKVPTMEFLSALTAEQARLFVEVCVTADGSPEWNRFDQHETDRMNAFTVAAVLAGNGPTVSASGTSCHLHAHSPYVALNNVRREESDYTGLIWCPVLPSGYWVARQDGKVHITGNSRKTLTDVELATITAPDDTNNRRDLDIPDQTWTAAGGALNNNVVKLLVCYDSDTTAGTDANIIPVTYHDFVFTSDGTDVTAVVAAAGFFRASHV